MNPPKGSKRDQTSVNLQRALREVALPDTRLSFPFFAQCLSSLQLFLTFAACAGIQFSVCGLKSRH